MRRCQKCVVFACFLCKVFCKVCPYFIHCCTKSWITACQKKKKQNSGEFNVILLLFFLPRLHREARRDITMSLQKCFNFSPNSLRLFTLNRTLSNRSMCNFCLSLLLKKQTATVLSTSTEWHYQIPPCCGHICRIGSRLVPGQKRIWDYILRLTLKRMCVHI